jgi:hypothetical protein
MTKQRAPPPPTPTAVLRSANCFERAFVTETSRIVEEPVR